jgi:hypothetical protein
MIGFDSIYPSLSMYVSIYLSISLSISLSLSLYIYIYIYIYTYIYIKIHIYIYIPLYFIDVCFRHTCGYKGGPLFVVPVLATVVDTPAGSTAGPFLLYPCWLRLYKSNTAGMGSFAGGSVAP